MTENDRTIIVVEESVDSYKMQKKVQSWLRNDQKWTTLKSKHSKPK